MTAALVAASEGLRTLLIEKSPQIGGTTARSSGTVWIPDNPQQHRIGITTDATSAVTYLDALVDGRADPKLRQAFVAAGPKMLRYLETHTGVRFQIYRHHPDYRQDLPGAAAGGRPLEPVPFDGRTLGKDFSNVRWPIPEFMLLGGMMVTRGEAVRLQSFAGSLDSLWLGIQLVTRYCFDRLSHPRGTRLVLGNALAANLYKNLLERNADIWLEGRTSRLIKHEGRACGLAVDRNGKQLKVRAKRGIVLAGGGFPASGPWRERYLPKPVAQYTAAFEGCNGDTLQLALDAGAAIGPPCQDNALWFPSSIAQRADGSTAVYPHIVLDRPKPGLVAVNGAGKRFVNEAISYHEFTRAMYASHRTVPTIPAWLVCDRQFLWKYGLGMIRPLSFGFVLKPHIAGGYLKVASTLAELAGKIGVNADGLIATVNANNTYAQSGVDEEFGKGDNIYEQGNGDALHKPNPCLGPIQAPPFYAVAVFPTPLGTSLGLSANEESQVLDSSGNPIPGLYCCGNDMNSILAGEYPGAGAQIGPAMTFGYLAAMHAAGEARPEST
ncbi:MAG: FAD-binding protein [Sulfuritalea sp.]|nr:FAD-binding protein [Sulfuritalea sp.]